MKIYLLTLHTLLIYIVYWIYSFTIVYANTSCIHGCKCSDQNQAVVCCPIDPQVAFGSKSYDLVQTVFDQIKTDNDYYLNDDRRSKHQVIVHLLEQCGLTLNTLNETKWPLELQCIPSKWKQLKIQLNFFSLLALEKFENFYSNLNLNCSTNLERLVITGFMDKYLDELTPHLLRLLVFGRSQASVNLLNNVKRLTIKQTQFSKISPGFLDLVKVPKLIDLELCRNPQLTDSGLGVGWLANAKNIKFIDLSRNSLFGINFARWGLPLIPAVPVTRLNLEGNHIECLKAQAFGRLPNLLHLNLANNFLDFLSLDVFEGLNQLKILDLKGNKLHLNGLNLNHVYDSDPKVFKHFTFASIFPDLRQLKLSNNPLLSVLSPSDETKVIWWLSTPCPVQFKSIYLEQIGSKNGALPPINWTNCPSLTELYLTHSINMNCIDRTWIGVSEFTNKLPDGLRVIPETLTLCPSKSLLSYSTFSFYSTISTTFTPNYNISKAKKNIDLISNSTELVRPLLSRNKNTSIITSWVFLGFIIFLVSIFGSLIIILVIYCICYFNGQKLNRKHLFIMNNSLSKCHSFQNSIMTKSFTEYPDFLKPYNFRFDLMKLKYPSYIGSTCISPCRSCSQFNLEHYHRPNCHQSQSVSPADSGLEDATTPLNYHLNNKCYSMIEHNSPLSNRTSLCSNCCSRSGHTSRNHLNINPKFPTYNSSFSSKQQSCNFNMTYLPPYWYQQPVINSFSKKTLNNHISNDNLFLRPASTCIDTSDGTNSPSNKPTNINHFNELDISLSPEN